MQLNAKAAPISTVTMPEASNEDIAFEMLERYGLTTKQQESENLILRGVFWYGPGGIFLGDGDITVRNFHTISGTLCDGEFFVLVPKLHGLMPCRPGSEMSLGVGYLADLNALAGYCSRIIRNRQQILVVGDGRFDSGRSENKVCHGAQYQNVSRPQAKAILMVATVPCGK